MSQFADPFPAGNVVDAVFWRRLDVPGHESAWLVRDGLSWHLAGQAVFLHRSAPCALTYAVTCDDAWHTTSARLSGRAGGDVVLMSITVDRQKRWTLNGEPCPSVAGCIDLDLNFTPATNTLSIRRLRLDAGGAAEVTAAWLDFPAPALRPLPQFYRRRGADSYDYSAPTLGFSSTLRVSAHGLITSYPPLWEREPPTA
jgi:hypothetical protein